VSVVLDYDGEWLTLSVANDGRGFEPHAGSVASGQPGSVGLLGLQERFSLLQGHLEITSMPGQGARLVASAPWREQNQAAAGDSQGFGLSPDGTA
jgi:signal transduction histidine kinase